jgi:diguanylate cyclase (GGDEF)-like protein
MEQLIFDEQKLRQIPSIFIFILVMILGLPIVAYNLFDIDLITITQGISFDDRYKTYLVESQVRGYFRQAILEWSAFSLACITVLLAFTQYRLSNDKIALIIGLSILFSGSVDALNTIIIDGITPIYIDKPNLDAVIWTFSNTTSGLICLFGLIFLLRDKSDRSFSTSTFCLISLFIVLAAFTLIYYAALIVKLPTMWDNAATFTRPYEMIYLLVYLVIAIVIYPKIYKKYPYILTNCIFYMSITEVVMAFYMMLLSNQPYDSAYYIAYFLKIIVYFLPFSCLIINYVFSYNAVLQAQINLQISKDKLKYLAGHDSLTNLYNRREFENQIDQRISAAGREKESFALFVIDIDNFKVINDTLGHIHGDEYIRRFADQLRTLTRKGDILSRIGGDEFTLITSKLKSKEHANILAKRLINGLHQSFPVGDGSIANSSSIGISIYPDDGKTAQELLRKADIAMYAAKNAGRNTYRFYSE